MKHVTLGDLVAGDAANATLAPNARHAPVAPMMAAASRRPIGSPRDPSLSRATRRNVAVRGQQRFVRHQTMNVTATNSAPRWPSVHHARDTRRCSSAPLSTSARRFPWGSSRRRLAVCGELSWLNLVMPQALFLVPLTRFPGFVWLIAAGPALPNTIGRGALG